jgi:hypothetical protein
MTQPVIAFEKVTAVIITYVRNGVRNNANANFDYKTNVFVLNDEETDDERHLDGFLAGSEGN